MIIIEFSCSIVPTFIFAYFLFVSLWFLNNIGVLNLDFTIKL